MIDRGPEHLPHPLCVPPRLEAFTVDGVTLASSPVMLFMMLSLATRFHMMLQNDCSDCQRNAGYPRIVKKIRNVIIFPCLPPKKMCVIQFYMSNKKREPAPAPKPFLC